MELLKDRWICWLCPSLPLPAPKMAKAERPPSHISVARSGERITIVGSGRSTFGNSWGTSQFPKPPCPRDGPSARSTFVPHEFPKVLLQDPTMVILSPNRAAEMCDGGRSALAILGARSGEALSPTRAETM
jgi:hypothetical protein